MIVMWNGDVTALKSYYCCLAKIMCNPASLKCYTDKCKQCLGVEKLRDALINQFKEDLVDEVTYNTVDRCTMESITKNVEDFVQEFLEKLVKLRTHSTHLLLTCKKNCFCIRKQTYNKVNGLLPKLVSEDLTKIKY
ncbi:hypothetical protein WA026_022929 [Henosepilachna vigintioctopunctata]|uniref:Uncharacterized protein n=1 Tax=Henosepilachna vigintioctopunctata TaxID=420089 RepID=A0AAW1TYR7_9CUCU